jgi:aminoglycoside phosphotransferase (APT) family kinase protein
MSSSSSPYEPFVTGDVPGLNLANLQAYLRGFVPPIIVGPVSVRTIAGGRSNLTYEVTDGVKSFIVRRPPLGHVLATAHDMTREYRVLNALKMTEFPVPKVLALCEDPNVLGAPFYVMEKVEGVAYRHAEELVTLGPTRTHQISLSMVTLLAKLHQIEPEDIGLGGFGRAEGYLERQVHRWKKQLDSSKSRDIAGLDKLYGLLAAHVPADTRSAIVHGDYRFDNLLIGDKGQITSVLDWEMATLGDPFTDVAMLMVYHRLAEFDAAGIITNISKAPGFASRSEIFESYEVASSHSIQDFDFFLGLAFFKLAGILEGIHFRYVAGQTVGIGFESIGDLVPPLIEDGLSAVQGKWLGKD